MNPANPIERVAPCAAERLVEPVAAPVAERRLAPGDWGAAIARIDGPEIVVGGPGTGKSEFLVQRVVHLVARVGVPSSEILVLSFGRRGVADLSERIGNGLDQLDPPLRVAPVPVVTFHGLAAGILDQHGALGGWDHPPQVLTGPEQVAVVRRLLASEPPAAWSMAFRELLGSKTFSGEVTDFLLRASEQMLGPDDIEDRLRRRDDWRGIPAFMRRYRSELHRTHRIDYGMLLAEATRIVETAVESADGPLLPHRYVLVDEYQDTTVSQVRLLAALTRSGHLTAAADPYQSIYSFRGAALQNVARFPETFRGADGQPAQRLVLTTSFRTPRRILEAAERVTERDLPGAAGRVTATDADGAVDIFGFEQQTEEAEWIAAEVVRLNREEHIRFRDMGVFVRSTRRFVPELSRALQRRSVPHDPPTSRLAEQPAVRFVLDLVTAATTDDPATLDRVMRRLLLGRWLALPLGEARDLERTRRSIGASWSETLQTSVPTSAGLCHLIDDPSWATELPAVEGAWVVWSTVPQLAEVAQEGHDVERAAWTSLIQVLSRWNERNPEASLTDYAALLLEEDFEARPLLSYAIPEDDRLSIATLHQAKGLELDVVFIADAVEGVFPDLRMRDSLLGVRHLLPDVPGEAAAYRRFRLQEERRLAYTAMTRARRRVVWTATATGFEEGTGVPSRFLALVAGTDTVAEAVRRPGSDRIPVTPAEAEAHIRRVAADPATPGPRRLAALDVLAAGEAYGLRPASRFIGMRDPGSDRGLIPGDVVLSPTQADGYDRCPRRYALERRLGIGNEPTPHAALGTLVHRVLEVVERAAMENGAAHGTAEAALSELERQFEEPPFGGDGPVATAWRRRAEAILRRLYERWPGKGRVVAVEHPLHLEIGGVRWHGVADRIEVHAGKLTVVDYKTSSSSVTVAEAAASLQLGFYLMAARSDPRLTAIGEPVRAELWYPWAPKTSRTVTTRFLGVDHLADIETRLVAAATGINEERWPPLLSDACDRCAVRTLCPLQPEGREGWVA